MRPLAIDLFTGLHGWAEGLIEGGFYVIGVDIVDMSAALSLPKPERFGLLIQDVRTLHGSQFRNADLIVASPPCQAYSYMAMPWSRAKAKAAAIRADETGEALRSLNELFDACFRIQREACAAAGRHIPMVVENVKGAQPWVGRAKWSYGSYYLWGDVPALMPATAHYGPGDAVKRTGRTMCFPEGSANPEAVRGRTGKLHWQDEAATKNGAMGGGSWFNIGSPGQAVTGVNPDGRKNPGFRFNGSGRSFQSESVARHVAEGRKGAGAESPPSKSSRRKVASAKIAKIPLTLSRWIGEVYHPDRQAWSP